MNGGGRYNNAYYVVQQMANQLEGKDSNPLRGAFAKHLKMLAKAMCDVERVDSGDCPAGQEIESMRNCLTQDVILKTAIEQTKCACQALLDELS